MPELILYKGRPVKHRERVKGNQLKLTFVNPTAGAPCERLVVTQAEWASGSVVEYHTRDSMPDVRDLARKFRS